MSEENKRIFIFAAVIIISFLAAWAVTSFIFSKEIPPPWRIVKYYPSKLTETELLVPQRAWHFGLQKKQLLFSGGYAYPSVIQQKDGKYLMYLAKRHRGTFILGSINAFSWYRLSDIIFPAIEIVRPLKNSDVKIFYPQSPNVIASSLSNDGVNNWSVGEKRVSLDASDTVNGLAVIKTKNDAYRMFLAKDSEIYGANSPDGKNWEVDIVPTVSSPASDPYVLNWTNPQTGESGYLMLYNADLKIFAAYSKNGFEWGGLGDTGIIGSAISAIQTSEGLRVYFSDLSVASGIVYTGILDIAYK